MADIDIIRRPSDFRKVELQSPADLQHLIAAAKRAARQKIDLAFPQSAVSHDDELRGRVEVLVNDYIKSVFEGVRHNVTVNGMDLNGEDQGAEEEGFEPVDLTMLERIRALEVEKEKLTEQVAGLRRTAPQKAAEKFKSSWASDSDALHTLFDQADKDAQQQTTDIDIGELKRWDEVQKTWDKSTEGLVSLKSGLTETVAKLERARAVMEHMEQR